MSHDKPFYDEMADVDAISSAVPPHSCSCDAQLPDWVHVPAEKVDQPTPAKHNADALLTVDDVAAYLRVSTKTVRRQIAAGHISAIRLGRLIRVSPEEVMRLTGINYNSFISNKEQYR